MGVHVRPASLQDGVAILTLLEDVGYYPEPISFAKTFRKTLTNPHFLVRVAEADGVVRLSRPRRAAGGDPHAARGRAGGGRGGLPRPPTAGRDDALQGRLPRRQSAPAGGAGRPALQLPGGGQERGRARSRARRAGRRTLRPRPGGDALPRLAPGPGRLLVLLLHGPAGRGGGG